MSVLWIVSCEQNIVKTTPIPSPVFLQGPLVTPVLSDQATIQWTTDMPCCSKVRYISNEVAESDDTLEILNEEYRQEHWFTIKPLNDNQTYHFRAISTNQDQQSVTSQLLNFRTKISLNHCWSLFESGNYAEALQAFEALADEESEEILLGLAWSSLRIDSLQQALENFENLYTINYQNSNALTGICIANYQIGLYLESIIYGELLWQQNTEQPASPERPFYVFEHDTSINNVDISIILAKAHLHYFRFDEVQKELDFLVPDNQLNSSDSATWKIDISVFSSYESVLRAYVDSLQYWFEFL